ncbi:hypothetical protein CDL15_Pgr000555 [Punica granatum]|uniref:Uncharacterized protein n=1 Tax=Punica granatum TaxID=22663 RepID=A0A218W3H9_PUNGR|nr:hypothetical protein CDL15_Pgr000555 [Punica granatum]
MEGEINFGLQLAMVGLPHIGRRRKRCSVMKFLGVAKDSIMIHYINNVYNHINKGIIDFVDGDARWKCRKHISGLGSLFVSYIDHYWSLLESMETCIPCHLGEVRIVIESLFMVFFVPVDALEPHDMEAGIDTEEQMLFRVER